MTQIRVFIVLAVLSAVASGVWWVMDLRADKAALTRSVAALEREADLAAQRAEQAALARDVARAEAKRLAEDAIEYQKIREWIRNDDPQEPIPDSLRAVLDRLFGHRPR